MRPSDFEVNITRIQETKGLKKNEIIHTLVFKPHLSESPITISHTIELYVVQGLIGCIGCTNSRPQASPGLNISLLRK